jgi:hypothetical protein
LQSQTKGNLLVSDLKKLLQKKDNQATQLKGTDLKASPSRSGQSLKSSTLISPQRKKSI